VAAPALASQGGSSQGGPSQGGPSQGGPSQGGPSQGGPSQGGPSQGRGDCRSPGTNLSPVKTGAVGAGGQVNIQGAGRVRLQGSFMSWGTVRGMTIRVEDRRGDGMLRVGAACIPFKRVTKADGTRIRVAVAQAPRERFLIDGTGIRVDLSGKGSLAIAITGSGSGVLDGVGTFTVNNGSPQSWPLKPIDLALAPAN